MKFCLVFSFVISLAGISSACDKGCVEYENVCACEAQPEKAVPVEASTEKPPKSGQAPWQAPGIHADMPKSLLIQNDPQIINESEGKVPVQVEK